MIHISRRRSQARMPELRLDDMDRDVRVREMRGMRVPQTVRMDALLDPGARRGVPERFAIAAE